jgi:hypothetical protein
VNVSEFSTTGRRIVYLFLSDWLAETGALNLSALSLLLTRPRQPKYAVIAGSLITPIGLGMIAYGIDEDKQIFVDGQVS